MGRWKRWALRETCGPIGFAPSSSRHCNRRCLGNHHDFSRIAQNGGFLLRSQLGLNMILGSDDEARHRLHGWVLSTTWLMRSWRRACGITVSPVAQIEGFSLGQFDHRASIVGVSPYMGIVNQTSDRSLIPAEADSAEVYRSGHKIASDLFEMKTR